jgi:hypothetical protein
MKNWKTTTLGVIGILLTVLQAGQELLTSGTVSNVEPLVTSLVLGWGLIAAKDNNARL